MSDIDKIDEGPNGTPILSDFDLNQPGDINSGVTSKIIIQSDEDHADIKQDNIPQNNENVSNIAATTDDSDEVILDTLTAKKGDNSKPVASGAILSDILNDAIAQKVQAITAVNGDITDTAKDNSVDDKIDAYTKERENARTFVDYSGSYLCTAGQRFAPTCIKAANYAKLFNEDKLAALTTKELVHVHDTLCGRSNSNMSRKEYIEAVLHAPQNDVANALLYAEAKGCMI